MPRTKDEVSYTIDFNDRIEDLPKNKRNRFLREAGDIIVQDIKDHVAKGSTPVSGGKYKRGLSKEYKKRKTARGGAPFSDMKLENKMLKALTSTGVDGQVVVGIDGAEAPKAFNHNVGDTLPQREFIPDDSGKFKKTITSKVNKLFNTLKVEAKAEQKKRTETRAETRRERGVTNRTAGSVDFDTGFDVDSLVEELLRGR